MNKIPRSVAIALVVACVLSACSTPRSPTGTTNSLEIRQKGTQQRFWNGIAKLCGNSYSGTLVSTDAADASMAAQAMVMHVSACSPNEIRIPFHVGDNRSRTWVLSKTSSGLRLKHEHRHEDGSNDAVSHYGGDTIDEGSAARQEFPADAESISMFRKAGLDASVANIWALETDDTVFAYELKREARFFRVEFDLTRPIATPPPAWGH